MTGPSVEAIKAALVSSLSPAEIEVLDDSAAHAGHVGAREGGHFRVRIACSQFAGLSPIARHRLVYSALAGLMGRGIHALSIDARLP
jgi:BolA family transcriptional regulator, general stress-responsive regulator